MSVDKGQALMGKFPWSRPQFELTTSFRSIQRQDAFGRIPRSTRGIEPQIRRQAIPQASYRYPEGSGRRPSEWPQGEELQDLVGTRGYRFHHE